MAKKKIKVDGLEITINKGYVSLTDIAKKSSKNKPANIIQGWLRNQSTISY